MTSAAIVPDQPATTIEPGLTDPDSRGAAGRGAFGLFGRPPADLVAVPAGAVQLSPLEPQSPALEDVADGALAGLIMLAPPGTLERRYALAHGLRALARGAPFTVLAPKDKGGSRIAAELSAFGADGVESARRHHRIVATTAPATPRGLSEAMSRGALQRVEQTGLWSQPGLFAWNRIDPGSALLVQSFATCIGRGADLGCGTGFLARSVLAASSDVTALDLIDCDRRALEAARRNVSDPRARFIWADATRFDQGTATLDFVVMNPPFHDGGAEDRALGQAFVRRAAALLRSGGRCRLVANRHLPYEPVLAETFKSVTAMAQGGGYKVYEAIR